MTTESKNYVMLFPGQGSQEKGMGRGLYDHDEETRKLFHQADNILGYSLEELCFQDPKGELSGDNFDTSKVQPALLLVSVATSRFLKRNGVPVPESHLGHSAGKIAAFVESGALDLEEALRFMPVRGRAIRSLAEELDPVVAVISRLDWDRVVRLFADIRHLAPSFLPTVENNTGQIVVGGLREQLHHVIEAVNATPGKIREYEGAPLSHHTLLQGAQTLLNQVRLRIVHPEIPTIDDLTGRVLQTAQEMEGSLKSHLVEPLRFRLGVESIFDQGIRLGVEVGPKNVLAGIMKRDHPDLKVLSTSTFADIENTVGYFNSQQ